MKFIYFISDNMKNDKREVKKTSLNLPIDLKNDLKIIAIKQNKTLTNLIIEILDDAVKKSKK